MNGSVHPAGAAPGDHPHPAGAAPGDAPSWAQRLSAGAPADLVARAVRLAASGRATPDRLQRVLAARLEAGAPTGAGAVLADLEAAVCRDRPLPGTATAAAVARRLAHLGARVHVVGWAGYPPALGDAWPELGAPAWLCVRAPGGRLPPGPAVAVVGTRHATADGLHTARRLGRLLAAHGVTVVSGMARGIDQAAHRGALDGGGPTVAVLGTGLDVDYPRGDRAIRAEVAAAGGLVTEFAPGVGPLPRNFLWRNRIISGLAGITVVVEGRARSGSLQTARLAASQGREVWAVPGSPNAATSRAPLDLIRDGAQVVTRLDDVLEAVAALPAGPAPSADGSPVATGATGGPVAAGPAGGPTAAPSGRPGAPRPALGADARAVLATLGPVPASAGAVAAATRLGLPAVLAALGELTARGLAHAAPRGYTAAPPAAGDTQAPRA